MKRVPIILLMLLAISGCENKEIKVEKISDDSYLTLGEVDNPPIVSKESFDSTWVKDIGRIISKAYSPQNLSPEFDSRLLINKEGKIDKIIIINSVNDSTDNDIVKMLEKWKIKPAMKNGKPVKFKARYSFKSKGESSNMILGPDSSLASNIPQSTYFVAVEDMPEPIGGIKAIQDKVVYPEIAKRAGIEGKVYVLAFINEEGKVVKARVLKVLAADAIKLR